MGKLYIVSTPIGNLEDITYRAIKILKNVDLILCEDTRVSKVLMDRYEIKTPIVSYRDQNHKRSIEKISYILSDNKDLALISDAGTPLISDPGFKLVSELVSMGFEVESIPGASAVTSSLVVSGLPTDRFTFLGFLPKSSGKRSRLLSKYMELEDTLIIYESPFRVGKLLNEINEIDSTRLVVVVNDQTKMYEKIWRGSVSEISEDISKIAKLKGEFVVLIAKDGYSLVIDPINQS